MPSQLHVHRSQLPTDTTFRLLSQFHKSSSAHCSLIGGYEIAHSHTFTPPTFGLRVVMTERFTLLSFSPTMFTQASGSNYYFTQYTDFSDAQQGVPTATTTTSSTVSDTVAMPTTLPPVFSQHSNLGVEEAEREARYYPQPYTTSAPDVHSPAVYSNYIQYESSLPGYMWPQSVEQPTWDGVSTDYVYTDTRYSEHEHPPQQQRIFEHVESQQEQSQNHSGSNHTQGSHHQVQNAFEGMAGGLSGMEVPPVPTVCGGFAQPKMVEYQMDGSMKPPFSYITLIVSAMMSNKEKRATLSEIYAWIMNHFAYYRKNTKR